MGTLIKKDGMRTRFLSIIAREQGHENSRAMQDSPRCVNPSRLIACFGMM